MRIHFRAQIVVGALVAAKDRAYAHQHPANRFHHDSCFCAKGTRLGRSPIASPYDEQPPLVSG
jgi:hypothetical protein